MKLHQLAVLIAISVGVVGGQSNQSLNSQGAFTPLNQQPRTAVPAAPGTTNLLLTPTSFGPDVPLNVPSFNVGFFSAQEQFHDLQIADLTGRLVALEGRANFLSGVIYAIGILLLLVGILLKMFWRGIVQAILAQNRILHG